MDGMGEEAKEQLEKKRMTFDSRAAETERERERERGGGGRVRRHVARFFRDGGGNR